MTGTEKLEALIKSSKGVITSKQATNHKRLYPKI